MAGFRPLFLPTTQSQSQGLPLPFVEGSVPDDEAGGAGADADDDWAPDPHAFEVHKLHPSCWTAAASTAETRATREVTPLVPAQDHMTADDTAKGGALGG